MPRTRRPGLWVMEASWSSRVTDVRTVRPVLAALQDAAVAKSAYHHINDPEDLVRSLQRWGQKQHAGYGIGYLAMHGSPGIVHIGRRRVGLADVAAALPPRRLASKVLHFGSCEVLAEGDQQGDLLRAFGVRAITGFTEPVDWFDSMAFELILFDALSRFQRMDALEAFVEKHHGQLARRVGFVIARKSARGR